MEQKRVYNRIEDLIEVEFLSNASGVEAIIRTKTRDISAGGIKVFLTFRLNPGDKMQLKIKLPGEKKLVEAQTVVVDSLLIGVLGDSGQEMLYETRFKFVKMPLEMKNIILHYVFECHKETFNARVKNTRV